jgi:hypothetical protein
MPSSVTTTSSVRTNPFGGLSPFAFLENYIAQTKRELRDLSERVTKLVKEAWRIGLFGQSGETQPSGIIAPDAFMDEHQASAQPRQSHRLDVQRFPEGRRPFIQSALLG